MTDVVRDRITDALATRYDVQRELGRGGMATVYLARDVRHDREVAVKVLDPDLGAVLGAERFLSEIKTTARLQHPHILPLLDSGEAAGLLFYVMPFVRGETLRARLERERQLPVADAVRIAREVADALASAHAQGIVHRDVKPENILLQDGHALVADFGIALAVQHAGGARMTQTGLSLGTPQYMSPEQAMGERTIDARSDIYALGAITYEMLVGEAPFTGPSVQAIVARVMSEEPRGLVKQRRAVPDAVDAAVLRALEKLPADRFGTATEFAAALDAPLAAGSTRALASGTRTAPAGRTRLVLGALAALAVLCAVLAVWGWTRPAPSAPVVRYRIVIDSVPAVKDWSGELAISPDGATIVRSGGPGGVLLVRRRDELAFSPLPGTEGAAGPFISPDGARVGFYVGGMLRAVPLAGGPLETIADSVPSLEAVVWGDDGLLYRSVLLDGSEVVARSEPRMGVPVARLTTVDTLAGELSHLHPAPLPGARGVLFQVNYRGGKRAIAVAGPDGGKHTILMEGVRARYAPSGHLLYTTIDGSLWAAPFDASTRKTTGTAVQVADRIPSSIVGPVDFDVSASGTLVYSVEDAGARRELVWVSRNGSRTALDSSWKGDFSSPALSADGTRLAIAMRDGDGTGIWIRSIGGGMPTKLAVEGRNSVEPAWSPDGQWVSFLVASGASGTGDVWRQRADGSGAAERVLQSRRPLSEQVWAPTGNTIVVRTTTPTEGAGDILQSRVGIDSVPVSVVATPRPEYSPVVSPDGKWLAYVSNQTGRFEVYVVPFGSPASAKWAISTGGGSAPRWSHRGDELFYLDPRSNMMAARLRTAPSFAVENTRVLFDATDFIQTSLSRRNFDVSADDQRFLMVQRADGAKRGQVVVVENWADEMRRRADGRR